MPYCINAIFTSIYLIRSELVNRESAMYLSQLTHLSIGPIWHLRQNHQQIQSDDASSADNAMVQEGINQQQPSSTICSQCGRSQYIQLVGSDAIAPRVCVVLANPITDTGEQLLFDNCMAAIGWRNKIYVYSLHPQCGQSVPNSGLDDF